MKKLSIFACFLLHIIPIHSMEECKNPSPTCFMIEQQNSITISALCIKKYFKDLVLIETKKKKISAPRTVGEYTKIRFLAKFIDDGTLLKITNDPFYGYGPPSWQLTGEPYNGFLYDQGKKIQLKPREARSLGKYLELLLENKNRPGLVPINLMSD